jgi:hypothetical protein
MKRTDRELGETLFEVGITEHYYCNVKVMIGFIDSWEQTNFN